MGKLFHPDSPLVRFMSNVADLVALNLLWLICCVPVVTIGPSTAALYTVARSMARKEAPAVARTFFQAFRSNFKKALLVFLALLLPMCLVAAYILMSVSGGLDKLPVIKYGSYIAIVIIGWTCSYAWPLLASFENTVGGTLKNAILLPLANPFIAIAVTVLNMLPVIVFLLDEALFMKAVFFWLVIGEAVTALCNMRLLDRLFSRFVQ